MLKLLLFLHCYFCTFVATATVDIILILKLQVSVLTDQVEAQGEKIRDLEVCLEGHQLKLNATEEMLQQVGKQVCFFNASSSLDKHT